MRPSNPSSDDSERGSAALEFIVVGLLLLVPLVYLIVTLGLIQGQSLGAEAGARHIARAVSNAAGADEAGRQAEQVLASVVREYGLDEAAVSLHMACVPATAECPSAGVTVTVTLRTAVSLPLVPPVLGLERMASIPLEASGTQKVSRFWGSE